jgi:hypothetical protein
MPIIGSGDQQRPLELMLESILTAAVAWMERGLPLRVLKIVTHSRETIGLALGVFVKQKQNHAARQRTNSESFLKLEARDETVVVPEYDAFISYCHSDKDAGRKLRDAIVRHKPSSRIFLDSSELTAGASWLTKLSQSLDRSRRIIALYTPDYWSSKFCTLEANAALLRQMDSG